MATINCARTIELFTTEVNIKQEIAATWFRILVMSVPFQLYSARFKLHHVRQCCGKGLPRLLYPYSLHLQILEGICKRRNIIEGNVNYYS
jgi:hypothetical protein